MCRCVVMAVVSPALPQPTVPHVTDSDSTNMCVICSVFKSFLRSARDYFVPAKVQMKCESWATGWEGKLCSFVQKLKTDLMT